MNKYWAIFIIVILNIYYVKSNEKHFHNQNARHNSHNHLKPSYPNKPLCLVDNKIVDCSSKDYIHNLNVINSLLTEIKPLIHRLIMQRPTTTVTNMNPIIHPNNVIYPMHGPSFTSAMPKYNIINNNKPYVYSPQLHTKTTTGLTSPFSMSTITTQTRSLILKPAMAIGVTESMMPYQMLPSYEKFARSLDYFERKFYMVTFNKLTSISPQDRRVNGMSFVQSGFFLHLTLMTLAFEVDSETKTEINRCLGVQIPDLETITLIRELISSLPTYSDKLKFRRTSRLMLWPGREVSPKFRFGPAAALKLAVDMFNGTERPEQIISILNQKIESDSGGAIRDTFDEDDISEGVTAVLTNTMYFRARWRSAPTVLNDTLPFHDAEDAPKRTVRMIKLNDIMGYADIKEWNAQALEIPYASPDLSLVIVVPRTPSLQMLATQVTAASVANITSRMRKLRVSATIPLYTLRMTLLLPNKLEAMGVSRLFNVSNLKTGEPLRLSHMVQRIMFWAEAGRHAYKDDGINWEAVPDMHVYVDRPYIFFVRWRNLTLMNGNFVL